MRPSRVGPLEEKSARLSKAFFSGGAASKLAVSFPPACAHQYTTLVSLCSPYIGVQTPHCARALR